MGDDPQLDPESADPEMVELATRLFAMAREGRTAELVAYLDAGVPVDLANQKGDSLLMLAAYNGRPDTVRALLERRADVDRPNDRGQTPLAGSVFKSEDEIVSLLLAGGADPEAGTPSARATAEMFERIDLLEQLRARPGTGDPDRRPR